MSLSNPKLREELNSLTNPPPDVGLEWLDVQVRQIEELKARHPHTIRLHTKFSPAIYKLNCFMFAFDIDPDAVRGEHSLYIPLGKDFVTDLLDQEFLNEKKSPDNGDVAIYFRNGTPTHAGKWKCSRIISKWGGEGTNIWNHALWEVPFDYGDEVRFYEPLKKASVLFENLLAPDD